MKKLFLCLANSKKYNQRCIAGIELTRSTDATNDYQIVEQEGKLVWIRPVSNREHGEVHANLVDHINLLDIVEVNVTSAVPVDYQTENVLFDNRQLQVVGRIEQSETILDNLLTERSPMLFGNKQSAVPHVQIHLVDHSLVFIKPNDIQMIATTNVRGNPQTRARFTYNHILYDLPVTDIEFEKEYSRNPNLFSSSNRVYFTVSLGVEYNNQHYKLIAGIIHF